MTEPREITLATLGGGAAEEMWREAYLEVMANIQDVNTDPKAKRELTLKFVFSGDDERHAGDVLITVATKLVGLKGHHVPIYYGRRHGVAVAVVAPTQDELFQEKESKPRLVVEHGPAAQSPPGARLADAQEGQS